MQQAVKQKIADVEKRLLFLFCAVLKEENTDYK